PPVFRGEHEYYRKDGSIMTGELQVIPHVDADGRVVQILGVTRDVSERRQFEAELRRLAVTDEVTGLWNRRHGEELLAAELADARAAGRPMALLMLDIDHFKSINDRHGHQGGDDALVEVSRRLRDSLPGTDMVSRWGGDEFVVLLRDCRIDEGLTVADKIRGRIADTAFESFGLMTVSVGAAELQPGDDLDAWLARADEALYKAKRSGRNAVRAY
ncbi:MAG TPA: GGDEF domain-containing protein, partial [Mycobacterium sp.]|nr:GGDEF domain-containing protein [Mycobacterium sp.]